MSVNTQALFAFNRPLPPPFNGLKSKKVKTSSTYGDGTESTLSPSLLKALQAYLGCQNGTGQGALGILDDRSVVEYKSAAAAAAYHLAVYDPNSGRILASVYDRDAETAEVYTLTQSGRDGSVIHMALLPTYMADAEFCNALKAYQAEANAGFPNLDTAAHWAAILCDNAYRRVKDETCGAHIKLAIDKSGNVPRLSRAQLDAGAFIPNHVLCGEFVILAKTGSTSMRHPSIMIAHEDFIGKYPLDDSRTLNQQERALVPVLPAWYVIPNEVVSICKHATRTTKMATPMRNFLLRGPAGTGKTMSAQAIAAGLGLPYVKYTCSANTEIYDFIGQVFPNTGKSDANIPLALPDLDDMEYDPEGTYERVMGIAKPGATPRDCMAAVLEKVSNQIQQLTPACSGASGPSYTYVETDFIRALKYGWLVEIQEPTVILQPGVLVGLNSLLEQSGSITLPTGEVIRRHPDTVVIVTTNIAYEGCRGLNQSVVDRMSLAQDIELPNPEVMVQRAMRVTGCEDEALVANMVKVISDMDVYMQQNGIADGSCGMRGLIDWLISTEITGDPYTSALYTVISKATSDQRDRDALIDAVLTPIFAPGRRITKSA